MATLGMGKVAKNRDFPGLQRPHPVGDHMNMVSNPGCHMLTTFLG